MDADADACISLHGHVLCTHLESAKPLEASSTTAGMESKVTHKLSGHNRAIARTSFTSRAIVFVRSGNLSSFWVVM